MANFKKVQRLSFFSKAMASFLGIFSVSKAGAESLLKKFRWVNPLSHRSQQRPQALPDNSDHSLNNFRLAANPISNPFSPQGVTVEALDRLAKAAIRSEKITRRSQKIEGAVIRGTWVQSVFASDGSKVYESGEIVDALPETLRDKVKAALPKKLEALRAFEKASSDIQTASWKSDPQLEVLSTPKNFSQLEWSMDFMNADETETYRAYLDESFQFKGIKVVAVHANDGVASVFPRGPKGSQLENVKLKNLDGSGKLSSDEIIIKSGLPTQAESPDLDFRFTPQDDRFDQVQAYFFADQSLKFFKASFDAEPFSQMEVKVQVGTNSNAAFYYGNRIRLGKGDGIRYSNLAQDPSIVMHEVGHAFVDRYSGLPPDGEGGSLNEGFADFFSATILDNPHMGESSFLSGPFVRSLENNLRAPADLSGGLYHASQVVSGTLWDLRIALGAKVADQIAFRTLTRLGPSSIFKDFVPALVAARESLAFSETDKAKITEVIMARGWEI